MATRARLTYPTLLTLRALAAGYSYGFDIMDATGLPSGTVYPLLRRLERLGCVAARWEDRAAARREGRPPRRHYRITGAGHAVLRRAETRLAPLQAARLLQLGPAPAAGS
jgi:DNA-binding PadR family transcriptional regulator